MEHLVHSHGSSAIQSLQNTTNTVFTKIQSLYTNCLLLDSLSGWMDETCRHKTNNIQKSSQPQVTRSARNFPFKKKILNPILQTAHNIISSTSKL